MDIDSAIKILKRHSKKKIANCYDDSDDIQEAILVLDECFEYPECSYMTVGQWLTAVLNQARWNYLSQWPN